ncbi:MAG: hypothetical protein ACLT76_08455 [Clostridium fessum]
MAILKPAASRAVCSGRESSVVDPSGPTAMWCPGEFMNVGDMLRIPAPSRWTGSNRRRPDRPQGFDRMTGKFVRSLIGGKCHIAADQIDPYQIVRF